VTLSIVDIIATELRYDSKRATLEATRPFKVAVDPCSRSRRKAHWWILDGRTMQCKHCRRKKPIPQLSGIWKEEYKQRPYSKMRRRAEL